MSKGSPLSANSKLSVDQLYKSRMNKCDWFSGPCLDFRYALSIICIYFFQTILFHICAYVQCCFIFLSKVSHKKAHKCQLTGRKWSEILRKQLRIHLYSLDPADESLKLTVDRESTVTEQLRLCSTASVCLCFQPVTKASKFTPGQIWIRISSDLQQGI